VAGVGGAQSRVTRLRGPLFRERMNDRIKAQGNPPSSVARSWEPSDEEIFEIFNVGPEEPPD
jgi:hypothetical protein